MRSALLIDLTIGDRHPHFFPLGRLSSLYLLTVLSIMFEVFLSSFLKISSPNEHLLTYCFAILLKILCVLFNTHMVFLLDVDYRTGLLLAVRNVALLEEGSHVYFGNTVLGFSLLTTDLPLRKQSTSLTTMRSIETSLRSTISDDLLTGTPPIQDEPQLGQSRSFIPLRLLEERVSLLSGKM